MPISRIVNIEIFSLIGLCPRYSFPGRSTVWRKVSCSRTAKEALIESFPRTTPSFLAGKVNGSGGPVALLAALARLAVL